MEKTGGFSVFCGEIRVGFPGFPKKSFARNALVQRSERKKFWKKRKKILVFWKMVVSLHPLS
ncbi:MAG: hypothetical protein IKG88_06235, partial [Bacteroidales bacterium]|nr:hypothetical protein [Bacteroidales bacterium]